MKPLALFRLVVLLAVVLLAQHSLAEDYTSWNLPEGAVARLGKGQVTWYDGAVAYSVLEGPTDAVWSVSFSPDGTTLASGSVDQTILLWDMTPYIATAIHTPQARGLLVQHHGRGGGSPGLVPKGVGARRADRTVISWQGVILWRGLPSKDSPTSSATWVAPLLT